MGGAEGSQARSTVPTLSQREAQAPTRAAAPLPHWVRCLPPHLLPHIFQGLPRSYTARPREQGARRGVGRVSSFSTSRSSGGLHGHGRGSKEDIA